MKRALRPRVAIALAGLFLFIIGFNYLVRADLTTPLTACVDYLPVTSGSTTVGGKGVQQVFRLGSSAGGLATCSISGVSANFTGLDPKAGTCPPGSSGSIQFLFGNSSTIGFNDFVYALKVENSLSNVALDTILTGVCAGRTFTSVFFCQMAGATSPDGSARLPTGLDFFFGSEMGGPIPVGGSSTIVGYTSPDPPALQPISIGSSGVSANGFREGEMRPPDTIPGTDPSRTPIYGACPTRIAIDKTIACSPNGPFVNGPQSAIAGAQIFYQIKVTNTGMTPLDNVVITDALLKASADLTPDFQTPVNPLDVPFTIPGHLDPGQMVVHVFGPFTATTNTPVPGSTVNGTNTANVSADYNIPNQLGNPSGQTFQVSANDSVTLNVVLPSIQCNKQVSPLSFDSLPVALNYTLKATNTGGADLAVVIDDPKLRAIITTPPAGITVNSVAIHAGAGFAAGMLTGGNLPASFPLVNGTGGTNTMAQVDITLTVSTLAGFQAIADGPTPPDSSRATNTMTTTGTVTQFNGCTNGTITVSCSSSAMTMFRPPCSIALTKLVACAPNPSDADFGATATTLPGGALVYRFTVTNTGIPGISDTLNNVVINDNRLGAIMLPGGPLPAGQMRSVDVPATAPMTVGPFTNTATATGTCATSGDQVTSTQVTASVTVINPQVNCTKLVNGVTNLPNYTAGQTLTYSLTASNAASSGVNLDLRFEDPLLSALPGIACKRDDTNAAVTLPFTFPDVPPGQSRSITCTVSFPTVDAFKAAAGGGTTLNNTLNVTGTLPASAEVCVPSGVPSPLFLCNSTASVSIMERPALMLTKEVACFSPTLDCASGPFQTTTPASPLQVLRSQDGTMTAAVVYRYRVRNTGDVTINSIQIGDDKLGTTTVGSLAPGAVSSFICTAPITPPPGLTTNTAQAVGTSAGSSTANNVLSNQATASVNVQQPALSCSLSATACATVGDPVTLTLKLTNGPVAITVNSIAGLPGPPIATPFDLAPNEMRAFNVTFTTTQATTAITATVSATVKLNGFCLVKSDGTSVSTQVSVTCSVTVSCQQVKCERICFRSPQYWLLNLHRLPGGSILIGGMNFNNPLPIQTNQTAIKMALQGGPGPLQQLNQEFVAAQLNLAAAGGSGSPPVINALWSTIGCPGGALANFAPVTLSNGMTIAPSSMLADVFKQAEQAIRANRTADMPKLAGIFDLLNGNDASRCRP